MEAARDGDERARSPTRSRRSGRSSRRSGRRRTQRGALQERRRGQARAWLWERIDAGLRDAFRADADVRAQLDDTLAAVDAGRLPVSVAARRLLGAFAAAPTPSAMSTTTD